jgi:serine/threonine protein kinase
MPQPSGARIGAYEIIGLPGAGGMGEVYRARDTNLGRDAALKILPDVFAADPDRLMRFHLLALFAERVHPTPRPLPDAVLQQLDALMTRRRPLLDMLTAERHRLEHAAAPMRREITRHIRWLERRIGAADRDLDDTIQKRFEVSHGRVSYHGRDISHGRVILAVEGRSR